MMRKQPRIFLRIVVLLSFLGCGRTGYNVVDTSGTPTQGTGATALQQNQNSTSTGTGISPITAPPATSYLNVTRDAALPISNQSTGTIILFDNVLQDNLKEYSPTTGRFTASVAGLYQVVAHLGIQAPSTGWANGNSCEIFISKSDGTTAALQQAYMTANAAGPCTTEVTALVALQAGQGIEIGSISNPAASTYPLKNNSYTNFSVFRLDSAAH